MREGAGKLRSILIVMGNSNGIRETETATPKKNKSPWFNYTDMFYTKNNRDDISAEQLSS